MATTAKALFRGAASTTTSTTLYTVPANTSCVVTDLVISNSSSQAQNFTIALDGIPLNSTSAIDANSTAYISIKQSLDEAGIVTGGASSSLVFFHISGVEVS